MAAPPASTKTSLQQRLSARARERWPELAGIDVKFRGEFAYVTGRLKDGDTQPLMRLRYGGSAARWGFAIYLASKDGYQDSALPTGVFAGAPEDALDTACGLLECPPRSERTDPGRPSLPSAICSMRSLAGNLPSAVSKVVMVDSVEGIHDLLLVSRTFRRR